MLLSYPNETFLLITEKFFFLLFYFKLTSWRKKKNNNFLSLNELSLHIILIIIIFLEVNEFWLLFWFEADLWHVDKALHCWFDIKLGNWWLLSSCCCEKIGIKFQNYKSEMLKFEIICERLNNMLFLGLYKLLLFKLEKVEWIKMF